MITREYVTNRLPHGTLWSRGLRLAEAEIGRGPEPSGRWARRAGSSGAGPADAWSAGPEALSAEAAATEAWGAGPEALSGESAATEAWAAQAA